MTVQSPFPSNLDIRLPPKATLDYTFLPRCAKCAEDGKITTHPHVNPKTAHLNHCPECGHPSGTSVTKTVGSTFNILDPYLAVVTFCFFISRKIAAFIEGIQKW
jgi:hypothetical protein